MVKACTGHRRPQLHGAAMVPLLEQVEDDGTAGQRTFCQQKVDKLLIGLGQVGIPLPDRGDESTSRNRVIGCSIWNELLRSRRMG